MSVVNRIIRNKSIIENTIKRKLVEDYPDIISEYDFEDYVFKFTCNRKEEETEIYFKIPIVKALKQLKQEIDSFNDFLVCRLRKDDLDENYFIVNGIGDKSLNHVYVCSILTKEQLKSISSESSLDNIIDFIYRNIKFKINRELNALRAKRNIFAHHDEMHMLISPKYRYDVSMILDEIIEPMHEILKQIVNENEENIDIIVTNLSKLDKEINVIFKSVSNTYYMFLVYKDGKLIDTKLLPIVYNIILIQSDNRVQPYIDKVIPLKDDIQTIKITTEEFQNIKGGMEYFLHLYRLYRNEENIEFTFAAKDGLYKVKKDTIIEYNPAITLDDF